MKTGTNNTYIAIMAGGIGSRFWPSSRESRPKQFLDILGVGKSLIRLTFERFAQQYPVQNILIVTNEQYRDLVKEHLPELEDWQILGEPSRNNTAPCVAYTAYKIQSKNPNAIFIIAPSDHIVLKESIFLENIQQAVEYANEQEALVTLGIQPSRPDTGYGYIKYESSNDDAIKKVIQFTEKPNLDKAKEFLFSGDYVWNAGIFIWHVKSIIKAFEKYAPEIYTIFEAGKSNFGESTEAEFIQSAYPTTPKISIDYAIMEKADNVYTLPVDFGWSDLGTWGSLHAEFQKDEAGNAVNSSHYLLDSVENCLIKTPKGKLIVAADLSDYIIVDEDDVLLIYPKSKEQAIKKVTSAISIKYGTSFK